MFLTSGETRGEIIARLKRDMIPTVKRGFMYWPVCDFITFKFIPVLLQVHIFLSTLTIMHGLEMSSTDTIMQFTFFSALGMQFILFPLDNIPHIHGKPAESKRPEEVSGKLLSEFAVL
ncbi:hypothetical protein GW17_00031756 [Ensete ventricosum]|uniref:Uncharacterized protein n=1 Tax=Ensete ventricosum TaxID=4639 RepID=A0A427AQS7_ENSVE|nr:hypothetical protein B296_00014068 [Ensete ventricosum]RWW04994.1 hypothetical protein GW17_00031756 [Ensete ventricosum]